MSDMGDGFRAMRQDGQKRNQGRVGNARNEQPVIEKWCAENGVSLKVRNCGAHWHFSCGSNSADWWPGTTRLVFDGAHDKAKFGVSATTLLQYLQARQRRAGR